MKKNICLCAIFFLVLGGCAATFGVVPIPHDKAPIVTAQSAHIENTFGSIVNKDLIEYKFNYNFDLRLVDPLKKQVLIVGVDEKKTLQKKPIVVFDYEAGKIVWAAQSLTPRFRVYFTKDLPGLTIFKGQDKIFAVDRQDGKIKWERRGGFAPIDFAQDLAYLKTRNDEGEALLQTINLQTGENLWKRAPFDIGWWGYNGQMVDDNTWLLSGDGLHTFNLKTGKGWDYEIDTDATGGTGRVIAAAFLSALTGVYSHAQIDRYENLTSNALIVEDTIYYASNRLLVSINKKTGEENWKIKLPKIAARSRLSEDGDRLILFGMGWCYKNNRIANYSEPYIAVFDKNDGEQILYKPLGSKTRVNHCNIKPNNSLFISGPDIYCLDISPPDKSVLSNPLGLEASVISKPLKQVTAEYDYGTVFSLVVNPRAFFIMEDDNGETTYRNLSEFQTSDSDQWAISDKGFIQFGKNLTILNWFPGTKIYSKLYEKQNLVLIRQFNKKVAGRPIKFIDNDNEGKLIGEIKTDLATTCLDDCLLLWGKDKFIVLPLEKAYRAYAENK